MQKKNEEIQERYELSMNRISEIKNEQTVPAEFISYFQRTAQFIEQIGKVEVLQSSHALEQFTLEQWQKLNEELYHDILPKQYEKSYANPAYAVRQLGETHGAMLSFLYTEIRKMIPYVFEERLLEITILNELFIEIYNRFEEENVPSYREIQQILYWFISDYSDLTVDNRVQEAIDPSLNFAANLIVNSDFKDLRYLYRFGEYISENEIQMAQYLNGLPEETIQKIADTFTEGYRKGFEITGKDLSIKKTVNIRFHLGFERIIREAIRNFEKMGLSPVIYRAEHKLQRIGYMGAIPNRQYDYDHKSDKAIYLDKPLVDRKISVMRTSYEKHKKLAAGMAGPAVMETFGEAIFMPTAKKEAFILSEKQQKLSVLYDREASQIVNQYIKGEERSFTIIAFPVPEIGDRFSEIFDEIVKINTLDSEKYQKIQQHIIDALDQGTHVHIKGAKERGNETELTVALRKLNDPAKETLFENCVADVNIPVGEVFTSPKLSGTNGTLHVTKVYLGEFQYRDLKITFKDGKTTGYSCANFQDEEENKKYILENILNYHDSLPLGEMAIGTNTTAYAAAKKYQIEDKLPILIAEKMGPHFAVGDTCYSWCEDTKVYNPDGKEIIARDNEISILRREDVAKAYFGCHTDITIPYEELELLEAVKENGETIPIIADGRFVLEGTEELNKPLKML